MAGSDIHALSVTISDHGAESVERGCLTERRSSSKRPCARSIDGVYNNWEALDGILRKLRELLSSYNDSACVRERCERWCVGLVRHGAVVLLEEGGIRVQLRAPTGNDPERLSGWQLALKLSPKFRVTVCQVWGVIVVARSLRSARNLSGHSGAQRSGASAVIP